MKFAYLLPLAACVSAIAGCTPPKPAAPPPPPPRAAGDTCVAEPGRVLIGRKADAFTGAEMLRLTSSREIRWVGPNAAVTMEYKFGRVTVGRDAAFNVVSVACS